MRVVCVGIAVVVSPPLMLVVVCCGWYCVCVFVVVLRVTSVVARVVVVWCFGRPNVGCWLSLVVFGWVGCGVLSRLHSSALRGFAVC